MIKTALIFFSLLFSANLYAQWLEVQLPGIRQHFMIQQAVWVDSLRIVGHDTEGSFVISEDAGNSFKTRTTGMIFLGSFSQPTFETGFVVDPVNNKLVKTTDTWQTYSTHSITDGIDTGFKTNKMVFCHFWDTAKGLVLGDSSGGSLEIWTTQDGGIVWERLAGSNAINFKLSSASSLPCFSELPQGGGYLGFPLEHRFLFRIADYGKTFTKIDIPREYDFSGGFAFKNASEGAMVRRLYGDTSRTKIAFTADGGASWDTSYVLKERPTIEYAKSTANYPEVFIFSTGSGSFVQKSKWEPAIQIDTEIHSSFVFYDAERGLSFFPTDANGIGARVFDPRVIKTSVKQVSLKKVNVYPNPFVNEINIDVSQDCSGILMDCAGKVIDRFSFDTGLNTLSVTLPAGVYFLNINNERTVKLIAGQ